MKKWEVTLSNGTQTVTVASILAHNSRVAALDAIAMMLRTGEWGVVRVAEVVAV